ncbi:THAP domain-containing protein 4-like [Fopius arisanus]|uniref:THAP domain-containing protein 4-like n=1 Tax=Fopius arisanus TaxID=64838 RepID=A0A9R1TBY0_9HYME|nr:PREDICTED: THAP domain-containing protein 4-like [Fopius arisanus]XP_011306580.1 PREDICTED: THAP domain-containing protein 4-like [Fopius arisanus]XP_011306581.1 PREDICTED: THAP domain-containing protein 4-like [Fopius arisanus]
MNRLPMHNALKHLGWLEGTWRTISPGEGQYPTLKGFRYEEEIRFISIGQPMFNYESQTWHPEKKNPMHREVGFLRVIPETNKVKLILAHNFGVTSIEEGHTEGMNVILESTGVQRMSEGTKDPPVVKLRREWKLDGETLEQIIYMATTTTPDLTEHLRAKYSKVITGI